jgi:hypothetical protein
MPQKKGSIPWNKGKKLFYPVWNKGKKGLHKHSLKTKLLMSISRKGKNAGKKHYNWKGKNANYRSIHEWITNKLGKPTKCQHCKRTTLNTHGIHWANISGKYKRDELSDWIRLCVKCHKKYDKINSLKSLAKRNVKTKETIKIFAE